MGLGRGGGIFRGRAFIGDYTVGSLQNHISLYTTTLCRGSQSIIGLFIICYVDLLTPEVKQEEDQYVHDVVIFISFIFLVNIFPGEQ